VIQKLKVQGKLGDYVRVEEGRVLIRARTPRDGYRNYMRVRERVREYLAKERT
jgi:hypothetical protein